MREEVLRAVLKADLIGFHTYDYARHFVSACTRILGLEVGRRKEERLALAVEVCEGLECVSILSTAEMPCPIPQGLAGGFRCVCCQGIAFQLGGWVAPHSLHSDVLAAQLCFS